MHKTKINGGMVRTGAKKCNLVVAELVSSRLLGKKMIYRSGVAVAVTMARVVPI